MPWAGLQFVIVVFPDHTQLLFEGSVAAAVRCRLVRFCTNRLCSKYQREKQFSFMNSYVTVCNFLSKETQVIFLADVCP